MDLTPYVDDLRRQLAVAAATGGEDSRALAERITAPLESAVRLTLLNVLSAAMDEVTRDLAPGSVEVRLRGIDPGFVVTPPPGEAPEMERDSVPAPASVPADTEDGATSRINLRLPAQLKGRIEEAAGREGLSVNAWLVRALASAVEPDDRGRRSSRGAGQRYTGWVR
jgi:hypothetical protein